MRAVTFDLWHTLLWDPKEDFHRVADEYRVTRTMENLSRLGRRLSRRDVEEAHRRHVRELIGNWRRFEDLSAEERMASYANALGMPWPDEELDVALRDAVGAPLIAYPPKVSDGALDALKELKQRGVAIGIISNTGTTWGEALLPVIETAGLGDLVDVTTFSDEMGIRKPRREIFTRTLDLLGVEPPDAVHVGDRLLADVAGAQATGMKGVLFTNETHPPPGYQGADALLDDFSRLGAVLEGLGR